MGLLYPFPAPSPQQVIESSFSKHSDSSFLISDPQVRLLESGALSLRTYGLPYVFWFYLVFIYIAIGALFLASYPVLGKLLSSPELIDQLIASLVILSGFAGALTLLGFYFYEKELEKRTTKLTISHSLFGISFHRTEIELTPSSPFEVRHFLDSPNRARIEDKPELKAFKNQGYFYLLGNLANGGEIIIDRHNSRKYLGKLKALLEHF